MVVVGGRLMAVVVVLTLTISVSFKFKTAGKSLVSMIYLTDLLDIRDRVNYAIATSNTQSVPTCSLCCLRCLFTFNPLISSNIFFFSVAVSMSSVILSCLLSRFSSVAFSSRFLASESRLPNSGLIGFCIR